MALVLVALIISADELDIWSNESKKEEELRGWWTTTKPNTPIHPKYRKTPPRWYEK